MTFIEQLKAHVGELVRLRTDLYWYNAQSYDGIKGRICLLLDATDRLEDNHRLRAGRLTIVEARGPPRPYTGAGRVYVLLLIDGSPKWVLTSREDAELIK
jgi:hypothetical protein